MDKHFINGEHIKTIIAESKNMKAGYGMCFLINAICYIIGIYFLIKYEICYWQFYFFIICAFVATTSLTNHFLNFILSIPKRIEKLRNQIKIKKEKAEAKKKYLQARYTYYEKIWNSFFDEIQKKFFIDLAKKHRNIGILPTLPEPFHLMELIKNKTIIKNYLINDFVVEEFDTLFLKWVRETQKV